MPKDGKEEEERGVFVVASYRTEDEAHLCLYRTSSLEDKYKTYDEWETKLHYGVPWVKKGIVTAAWPIMPQCEWVPPENPEPIPQSDIADAHKPSAEIFSKLMAIQKSTGGVVFRRKGDGTEVLWLHRDDGTWTLPKGDIKLGETVDEAAVREISEETGLKRESLNIVDYLEDGVEYNQVEDDEGGRFRLNTISYYLVEAKNIDGNARNESHTINGERLHWRPLEEPPDVGNITPEHVWYVFKFARRKLRAVDR